MAKVTLITLYDIACAGIRLLASHLEEHGHEANLVFFKRSGYTKIDEPLDNPVCYEQFMNGSLFGSHYDVNPWTEEEERLLIEKIRSLDTDILGLSIRSFMDGYAPELLKRIRKECDIPLVLGGGFGPTFNPKRYLEVCDLVVLGEGEDTMLHIADCLDRGDREAMRTASNLAYMDGDEVRINPPYHLDKDLDDYPFMKVGDKGMSTIENNELDDRDPVLASDQYLVLGGRGCVGKCSYCSSGNLIRLYDYNVKKRRNRDIVKLIKEMKRAREMGFKRIWFLDEYFVLSTPKTFEFIELCKKEVGLPFRLILHPLQIVENPDLLDAYVDAGLTGTTIGVQSGCPGFAKDYYNRTSDEDLTLKFARLLKERGMRVDYHFITNNPFETMEDLKSSILFMKQMPFDYERDRLYVFRLNNFPQTPMTRRIEGAGLDMPDSMNFLYNGLLYYVLLYSDQATLEECMAREDYRENPYLLRDRVVALRLEKMMELKSSCLNWQQIPETYAAFMERYAPEEIVVWGAGSDFTNKRHVFGDTRIRCIVDSNKKLHGQEIDGIPVVPPKQLDEMSPAPIMVCSYAKPEIVKTIRRDYPAWDLLP